MLQHLLEIRVGLTAGGPSRARLKSRNSVLHTIANLLKPVQEVQHAQSTPR